MLDSSCAENSSYAAIVKLKDWHCRKEDKKDIARQRRSLQIGFACRWGACASASVSQVMQMQIRRQTQLCALALSRPVKKGNVIYDGSGIRI